ncbi:hypothetical protein Tsp_02894 [Trichinella spiralis]|uniref:hypothetical protein n=1 Tax=Trichinella spiralis TaxID=6334 RepID=UPI0001EFCB8F|nr:conserved hypothetical protein [Trichinella spiralis]XP_003379226.1 hypothetical protein Tsp_02894 [Trichinella spiralis]
MSVKLKAELKLWFIRPNQRQRLLCIAHSLSQIHFQDKHSSGNKRHQWVGRSESQRMRKASVSTKQPGGRDRIGREREKRGGGRASPRVSHATRCDNQNERIRLVHCGWFHPCSVDQLDTDNSDIDFSPARGRHP